MPQQITTDDALSANAGGVEQKQKTKVATPFVTASSTTVSANLVDQGNNVWAGAFIIINFVPAPNVPGPYMWGGGPFTLNPMLTADGQGHFSISLPDNTTITPSGSTWQFVIAPAATLPAVVFNIMIAGATMDISSIFTSQSYQVSLGTVQSLPLPRAYTNSDVATPPNTGQLYFNTTTQRLNIWQTYGAGVGTPAPGWVEVPSTFQVVAANTNIDWTFEGGSYISWGPFFGNIPNPPTAVGSWDPSYLEVFSTGNTDHQTQVLWCPTDAVTGRRFTRVRINGTWYPWQQIVPVALT